MDELIYVGVTQERFILRQSILCIENMGGIYNLMEKDWDAYVLMMSIVYIEELSKPTKHIQIKRYKNKKYHCKSFHSVRLKMNNEELVQKFFDITKQWELKKGKKFIGASFDVPRKENWSNQDIFFLSPVWLNEIIAYCGKIPNKYSYETAIERIKNIKHYPITQINEQRNLFNILKKDKVLAARAFIVSIDLECKGAECGRITLCMSEKYKDFLKFMLGVANEWGWATNNKLFEVDMSYSRARGINASDQFAFSLSIEA